MGDFACDRGGSTLCGPSWGSHGWEHEPLHKLYVVETGGARYAVPGQEVALEAGRLYLIPGARAHRYGAAAAMRVHWLHLRATAPAIDRRLTALTGIQSWPLKDWDWWRPAWQGIPAWLERRDLAGELRIQAFAAAVVGAAIAGQEPGQDLDPRLDAALAWMEAHCRQHPPVAAAARVAGLAEAVFQRRFRASCGTTPRAWMEMRRLDQARQLLQQPGATVQEVAAACGYANPFHFSRVVRRRLGVSPSGLRARTGP